MINPSAAELFVSIFPSFKAGIANAIFSASNEEKNYIYKKIDISNIELLEKTSANNFFITPIKNNYCLFWRELDARFWRLKTIPTLKEINKL